MWGNDMVPCYSWGFQIKPYVILLNWDAVKNVTLQAA